MRKKPHLDQHCLCMVQASWDTELWEKKSKAQILGMELTILPEQNVTVLLDELDHPPWGLTLTRFRTEIKVVYDSHHKVTVYTQYLCLSWSACVFIAVPVVRSAAEKMSHGGQKCDLSPNIPVLLGLNESVKSLQTDKRQEIAVSLYYLKVPAASKYLPELLLWGFLLWRIQAMLLANQRASEKQSNVHRLLVGF